MSVARKPRPRRSARRDGGVVHAVYTLETALEICARLAGGAPWKHICARGRLPGERTLYTWRDKRPAFAEALAQAREIALERDGRPSLADLNHLKGLLMAEKPRPQRSATKYKRRPMRGGKILVVRYGADVAREICARLAAGEIWERIAGTGRLPTYSALYKWRDRHPEFAAALEAARRNAAEARFEKALAVAEASTPATVQSDKLHVATLLHHAERLDPERFGRGARGEGEVVQRIVVRRFERAIDEHGAEYVRAIDSIQERERDR